MCFNSLINNLLIKNVLMKETKKDGRVNNGGKSFGGGHPRKFKQSATYNATCEKEDLELVRGAYGLNIHKMFNQWLGELANKVRCGE